MKYKVAISILIVLVVTLFGIIAWLIYKPNEIDKNSYQYKKTQIDACMNSGVIFTEQLTIQERTQKKLDYCTNLNR